MKTYGLIGKNISYSFSRSYFSDKFSQLKIDAEYVNFDLQNIEQLYSVLKETPNLGGLNVTIPYKEQVIPFLTNLDPIAKEIGAVNTIKLDNKGALTGYNTDYYGFQESLRPHLKDYHKKALILGTGGASKAIAYTLQKLNIDHTSVSRSAKDGQITYTDLNKEVLADHLLIINCTPLGTFPDVEAYPPIPVEFLTSNHLLYDLIYNPKITQLMKLTMNANGQVTNGEKMLELQAEKAWEIWNK